MNCKNWEESIYLFEELTPKERERVIEHVGQCTACSLLFAEVQHVSKLVNSVSEEKPQLRHPELLTQRIMKAVEPQKRERWFTIAINHYTTRYAMAACSLVLILFFIREQQSEFKQSSSQTVNGLRDKSMVVLDTKDILKTVKDGYPEKTATSLFYCLKTNQCDNTVARYFKTKR